MSQCVPSWDLDNNFAPPRINVHAHSNSSNPDVPSLDYEVAELTWENGQLAMHGLGLSRVVNKSATVASSPTKYTTTTWDKPRAGGTLESIVNQATNQPHPKSAGDNNANELVPWFDHHRAMVNPAASASITMTMDALVPCNNNIHINENSAHVRGSVPPGMGTCANGCSTRVGSCSAAGAADGRAARAGICGRRSANVSVSESATCGGGETAADR
ncbi:hypothetical protein DH2020_045538 [Rehmannia glutinosa]|uniref:Uncharacterized protein n=1 Tax=Rehmannia glutinosa TaxID=99300 RepID=A0ABR0UE20_REHGL